MKRNKELNSGYNKDPVV